MTGDTMTNVSNAALPYPLPEGWGMRPSVRGNWITLIFWSAVAGGFLYFFILAFPTTGWGLTIWLLIPAVIALCIAGLQLDRAGGQQEAPTLINGVVLMEGTTRITDDWVHFFRRHPEAVIGYVLWFLAGAIGVLGSLALLVSTMIRDDGYGYGAFVFGALSLVLVRTGFEGLWHSVRDRSFAQIPLGLTLSRNAVSIRELEAFNVFEWSKIRAIETRNTNTVSVKAGQLTGEKGADPGYKRPLRRHYASILIIDRGDDKPFNESLDAFAEQPWLIYTTLMFYWQHPELRHELGTTFAQKRMEAWNAEILQQDRVRARKTHPHADPNPV